MHGRLVLLHVGHARCPTSDYNNKQVMYTILQFFLVSVTYKEKITTTVQRPNNKAQVRSRKGNLVLSVDPLSPKHFVIAFFFSD